MLLPRPIPAFKDNYIWMLIDPISKTAAVVDPGDAAPVLQVLVEENLSLTTIMVTHHHYDHSGGALELRQKTNAQVYGPNSKLFEGAIQLKEGDIVTIPNMAVTFNTYEIPGHTLDHISLISNSPIMGQPILFCGDTLFTGGAGRVFEGSFEQMLHSLQRLKKLDPSTLIYCGHEYTEANLKFAAVVEPDNKELKKRMEDVVSKRRLLEPTVPSHLLEELNTNPFLRTNQKTVHLAAEEYAARKLKTEVEVFATIRKWKNDFS